MAKLQLISKPDTGVGLPPPGSRRAAEAAANKSESRGTSGPGTIWTKSRTAKIEAAKRAVKLGRNQSYGSGDNEQSISPEEATAYLKQVGESAPTAKESKGDGDKKSSLYKEWDDSTPNSDPYKAFKLKYIEKLGRAPTQREISDVAVLSKLDMEISELLPDDVLAQFPLDVLAQFRNERFVNPDGSLNRLGQYVVPKFPAERSNTFSKEIQKQLLPTASEPVPVAGGSATPSGLPLPGPIKPGQGGLTGPQLPGFVTSRQPLDLYMQLLGLTGPEDPAVQRLIGGTSGTQDTAGSGKFHVLSSGTAETRLSLPGPVRPGGDPDVVNGPESGPPDPMEGWEKITLPTGQEGFRNAAGEVYTSSVDPLGRVVWTKVSESTVGAQTDQANLDLIRARLKEIGVGDDSLERAALQVAAQERISANEIRSREGISAQELAFGRERAVGQVGNLPTLEREVATAGQQLQNAQYALQAAKAAAEIALASGNLDEAARHQKVIETLQQQELQLKAELGYAESRRADAATQLQQAQFQQIALPESQAQIGLAQRRFGEIDLPTSQQQRELDRRRFEQIDLPGAESNRELQLAQLLMQPGGRLGLASARGQQGPGTGVDSLSGLPMSQSTRDATTMEQAGTMADELPQAFPTGFRPLAPQTRARMTQQQLGELGVAVNLAGGSSEDYFRTSDRLGRSVGRPYNTTYLSTLPRP